MPIILEIGRYSCLYGIRLFTVGMVGDLSSTRRSPIPPCYHKTALNSCIIRRVYYFKDMFWTSFCVYLQAITLYWRSNGRRSSSTLEERQQMEIQRVNQESAESSFPCQMDRPCRAHWQVASVPRQWHIFIWILDRESCQETDCAWEHLRASR